MRNLRKKPKPDEAKKDPDGIVVIRERDPEMCGGTSTTLDTKAPKEIRSENMILFDATSALGHQSSADVRRPDIAYVSAFAVPAGKGSFVFLETGNGSRRRDGKTQSAALLKENIFPKLCRLVRECRLADRNGYQSHTYGLPENFGGTVSICYEDGEKISYSNNQSPVLTYEAGVRIAEFFENAMKGERQELPDVGDLASIRFSEDRAGGGFTKAELTLNGDGTGTNRKKSRFDVHVYESTKEVSADTVSVIKENIEKCRLFAWKDLPGNGYGGGANETLEFVFRDGREITVRSDRLLPYQISRGFFNIQLEMTTKH
jgi:hypothetical protein